MTIVRLLRAALKTTSVFTFGGSLFCGWLFYVFYLKWIFRFENGRYFDPVEEVVYHDTSIIWGVFSFVLLLVAIAVWLLASKLKVNPATPSSARRH